MAGWHKAFTLEPGEYVVRAQLHADFGGSGRGGIAPLANFPGVFFFTSPESGLQHGYVDYWDGEVFHYAGEGQKGDQAFAKGNKAVLLAQAEGRRIMGFNGTGGKVRYLGEFELDPERPWYCTFAPETGGKDLRQVIMFRLRPLADRARWLLPHINEQLQLGTVYRPFADYIPGMVAPPRPIDGRRRPLSASERGLLEWWLASTVAATHILPLSAKPTDPAFDLAYRAGRSTVVCTIDDPDGPAVETARIKAQILRLKRIEKDLGTEVVKTIALRDAPHDSRFEPALREKGFHLTWAEGPRPPKLPA